MRNNLSRGGAVGRLRYLLLVLSANGPDDWLNVLVCLGGGTCGFRFDQDLAAQAGVKRMFARTFKTEV